MCRTDVSTTLRKKVPLDMIQTGLDPRDDANTTCSTNEEDFTDSSIEKDYFTDLPVEIQLKIFSHFDPPALSKTIAPVCKKWWTLSKDASLWRKLVLSVSSKDTISTCCEVLLRCHLLKSLTIKSDVVPLDRLLRCTVSLSKLKILNLGFCKGLNESCFEVIASNCPLIECLNVEGCQPGVEFNGICHIVSLQNLRGLNLSHCMSVDDACVKTIAKKCLNLESLNIDGITRITDDAICELVEHRRDTLLHLHLDGVELTDRGMLALSLCQKLFTLKVSFGELLSDETLRALSFLPCLHSFKLRRSPNFSAQALEHFFHNPRLMFLMDLEIDSLNIDDRGIQNLAKTCRNLRRLSLPWCWEVSDDGLKSVVEYCNRLRALDLLGLYRLTGESLIQIPTKLPELEFLNLEQCHNILDTIARGLARKMPQLEIYSYYGDIVQPTESDEEDNSIDFFSEHEKESL